MMKIPILTLLILSSLGGLTGCGSHDSTTADAGAKNPTFQVPETMKTRIRATVLAEGKKVSK